MLIKLMDFIFPGYPCRVISNNVAIATFRTEAQAECFARTIGWTDDHSGDVWICAVN